MHLQGAGGDWHDAWLCYCLQLAAPIGLSPLTAALPSNPFPPQLAVPIGLSPPRALPLPAWPILPLVGCANGAPGLSLLHCSVSRLHGGGQLPSPLARYVQVPIPAVGDPSPTAAFGPQDVHLQGHLSNLGT